MPNNIPDLVIFDCDGTLVDTERVQMQVQSKILTDLGLVLDEGYFIANLRGKRFETILAQLSESHGLQAPDGTATLFKSHYWEALETADTDIAGAREAVLDAAAITKICVASNGSHAGICKHMQRLNLMPPLTSNTIFSAVDIGALKPQPDIFLHAMREMNVSNPQKVVVVEDSYTGLRAGMAAAMNVIWLKRSKYEPTPPEFQNVPIVTDLSQLGQIIFT